MASSSNNNGDNYVLINAELYRCLVTGTSKDFHKITSQIDILQLRCARDRSTVLHVAASSSAGQDDLLEEILQRGSGLMVKGNCHGDYPIHSALKTGRLNAVKILIGWIQKNDIADSILRWNNNKEGNTALHIALLYNEGQIAKDLVDLYPPKYYVLLNNEGICPLYLAIKKELSHIVQNMLQKLQTLPVKDDALASLMKGKSVLHAAVSVKKKEMLEQLLGYDKLELINLMEDERTALSYAAYMGYLEEVEILFKEVPDIAFKRNKDGSFPIHHAVNGGDFGVINLLKESLSLTNAKGQNALHLAAQTGNSKMVTYMLTILEFSIINQKDEDGNTPLHLAALDKHLEVVEILIQDAHVDAGLLNKEGLTGIILVEKLISQEQYKDAVQRISFLLERAKSGFKSFPIDGRLYQHLVSMELNQVSQKFRLKDLVNLENGNNVLHIAACMNNPMLIVNLLVGQNCTNLMCQANKKGDLPIHLAVKTCRLQSLEALFQWSDIPADRLCERPNMDGNTALHVALLHNQQEIANFLFAKCPQAAYCSNKDNISPLFLAINNCGECDLVNSMIQGLVGNEQHQNSLKHTKSVVHLAIYTRRIAILNQLVEEAPILVDSISTEGQNPLSFAAQMGYVEEVKLLVENFSYLKFQRDQNEDGFFPIHHAAKENKVEIIKLLQYPIIANKLCLLNNKSQNILHVAAIKGHWNVVNYLLSLQEFKDVLNAGDDDGNTPLHLAVKGLHCAIVKRLVHEKSHIDCNSKNYEFLTARDMFELNLPYLFDNEPVKRQKALHLNTLLIKSDYEKKFVRGRRDQNEGQGKEIKLSQAKDNDSSSNKERNIQAEYEQTNFFLLIATIIISVTYAATCSPPGGYNQDTGLPSLSKKRVFQVFIGANYEAFFCALLSALILIFSTINNKMTSKTSYVHLGGIYLFVGLFSLAVAFLTGTFVSNKNKQADLVSWIPTSAVEILILFGVIPGLILFGPRVNRWWIQRKFNWTPLDPKKIGI